jgi:hypothetical protein
VFSVIRVFAIAAVLALTSIGLVSAAVADDWVVAKLRGSVLQMDNGTWVALHRGDIVSDDRAIRTLASGRVELHRNAEVISLGPNSQAEIHDRKGGGFTTVKQITGTVAVEAEVKKVKHFGVETPYLAAVVKGTRFEVSTDVAGSKVKVTRGAVEVTDRKTGESVVVSAGESIEASKDNGLHREGGLELAKQKSGGAAGGTNANETAAAAKENGDNGNGNRGGNGN